MKSIENILNPTFWIVLAIMLFFFSIILSCFYFFDSVNIEKIVNIIEEVIIPLWTAIAFCVGFSLTIRRTSAIENQSDAARLGTNAQQKELKFKEEELRFRINEFESKQKQYMLERQQEMEESFSIEFHNLLHTLDKKNNTVDILNAVERLNTIAKERTQCAESILKSLCVFIKDYSHSLKKWQENNTLQWEDSYTPQVIQVIIGTIFSPQENIYERYYIDLTECYLQNIDFSGLHMKNVNFGGSDMRGARMYSKTQDSINLGEIKKETQFISCSFYRTNLQSANMAKAIFHNCDFSNSQMIWANMFGVEARICKFINSDMTCTLLSKSKFTRCLFKDSILDGADIYGERFRDNNGKYIYKSILKLDPIEPNMRNVLENVSLKFAYIFPHIEFFYSGKDKDSAVDIYKEIDIRGIDTSDDLFEKPVNRLKRLIDYLEKNPAQIELPFDNDEKPTVKNSFKSKNEKYENLYGILEKTFKYVTPADDLHLSEEEIDMYKLEYQKYKQMNIQECNKSL